MKKRLLAVTMVMMLVVLAGCSGAKQDTSSNAGESQQTNETKDDGYPNKPINVIVSYAAGGGTDVGARILLPYVEKELGVPINVINKPGGGGWVGWTELLNANPDGYTLGYINTPNLMTGYLNPEFKRTQTFEDFASISNHVLDYGAIAVKADDTRFNTIEDVIELAKSQQLTTTTTGLGSDDHIAALKLNKATGANFDAVHMSGFSEGYAAILGGHVDVLFGNVGEVVAGHNNGDIRVLAIMSEERNEYLPDVPTLDEAGYEGVYSWSARGLAAPNEIDQAKLDKLVAAFRKAMEDPEHIEKMNELGLQVEPMGGQEYFDFIKADEDGVKAVSDLLGW